MAKPSSSASVPASLAHLTSDELGRLAYFELIGLRSVYEQQAEAVHDMNEKLSKISTDLALVTQTVATLNSRSDDHSGRISELEMSQLRSEGAAPVAQHSMAPNSFSLDAVIKLLGVVVFLVTAASFGRLALLPHTEIADKPAAAEHTPGH